MALESLAALGFASNIVQFLDFGSKLFSKGRELYLKGDVAENVELETILASVSRFNSDLLIKSTSEKLLPQDEADLIALAETCQGIAQELKLLLQTLQIGASGQKWQSLRISMKRIRKSDDIEHMAKRLDQASNQLTNCLVRILNVKQYEVLSSLGLLNDSFRHFELQRRSDLESLNQSTLAIVQELRDAQGMQTSSDEKAAERDELRAFQLNQLCLKLDKMTEMRCNSATETQTLESLCFKSMGMRHAKILGAHAHTFEWIFHPRISSDDIEQKNNYHDWLIQGNGMFWISGKAGSGKSTLMKFLSGHKATKEALQEWAGEKELVIASFYFWHAGTELERSQEGLLQSLLYEILAQCPSLIPVVLPERWQKSTTLASFGNWSPPELMDAFGKLSQPSMLIKRFFFFIDGLDEYDGNHTELIQLLQRLKLSQDIKICASSRPWNVFEVAFGETATPRLRLQDLTRTDIKLYVRSKLEENRLFSLLKVREPQGCNQLVYEVVDRANGVFLWVFLVVDSILRGLDNADRISDLQRRLRQLSTGLNKYFQHILGMIDDTYLEQTAKTFNIALRASGPLSLITYSMLDELEENPRFAMDLKCGDMPKSEIQERRRDMRLRINARCMGLLKVTKAKTHNSAIGQDEMGNTLLVDNVVELNDFFDRKSLQYTVDFLHRTVRDFLESKETQALINARMPKDIDLDELLC